MQNPKNQFVISKDIEDLNYHSPDGLFSLNIEQIDKHIIKITITGQINDLAISISNERFDWLFNAWKRTPQKPPLYFIADVKHIKKIGFRSRREIQQTIINLFQKQIFRHGAIIGSNYLSLTLGIQLVRYHPEISLSFHRSEEQAINRIHQIEQISKNNISKKAKRSQKNLNNNLEQITHILTNGHELPVKHRAAWDSHQLFDDFKLYGAIINDKIMFIKAAGTISPEKIDFQTEVVNQMLEEVSETPCNIIFDYSDLNPIGYNARKWLEKREKEYRNHWDNIYLVLKHINKNLFSFYKTFFSQQYQYIHYVSDVNECLSRIQWENSNDLIEHETASKTPLPPVEPKKLNRKELEMLVEKLQKENQQLKTNQKSHIDELFEVISRITWDESFHPKPLSEKNPNDPFYLLYNSIELLQGDVNEMLSRFKYMNQDLEEKIKDSSHELIEKEANLRSLIENTTDMICLVDKNYNILVVNNAYQNFIHQLFGEKLKPGDNLLLGVSHEIIEYWKPLYERVLAGETFQTVEQRLLNGRNLYLQVSFNPILHKDGDVSGFSFFIKNITAQKESEMQLLESQNLLLSINHNIKEGLYRSNEAKQLIYVNKAFVEMFGYQTEAEVKSIPFSELYARPIKRKELIAQIQAENKVTNKEVAFRKKDGSIFWGLLSSIRQIDEDGNEFYDGAIRDITEIKTFENRLINQNKELKKVNNELDRFVYSASHDLRAPLMSILGLINVARLDQSGAQLNDCLNYMERSIKKLDSFIMDIIHLSRNSRQEIRKDKIDFNLIIKSILEDLRYHKKNTDVKKIVQIEQSHEFISDQHRVNVILYNLISNSIIYRSLVREQSFVEINVKVDFEQVKIVIEDNGEGITEQHQPKVFDMFYRASEENSGSGLGLYIVKETLEKLEGKISMRSEVGRGTTFVLTIPNLAVSSTT